MVTCKYSHNNIIFFCIHDVYYKLTNYFNYCGLAKLDDLIELLEIRISKATIWYNVFADVDDSGFDIFLDGIGKLYNRHGFRILFWGGGVL